MGVNLHISASMDPASTAKWHDLNHPEKFTFWCWKMAALQNRSNFRKKRQHLVYLQSYPFDACDCKCTSQHTCH